MMSRFDLKIPLVFTHRIVFTHDAFAADNAALAEIIRDGGGLRAIAFLDDKVAAIWPGLVAAVQDYFEGLDVAFCGTAALRCCRAARRLKPITP